MITRPLSVPDRSWFADARFGLFVHWGLYALLGRGEWVFQRERIPADEYARLAHDFRAEHYDPRAWAALARDAGMRYAVFTTKHHDGFCLWDSKLCTFNAVNSAARRDLLAEFVTAFREAGLKVGLYFSLGDFRNPDWFRGWQGDAAARGRFMDWTAGLLDELLTGYGPVDILWYDLPQNYSAAEWRSAKLNARARALHPGIVINNRAMTPEDFGTPEQHVAAARPGRMWEACLSLNEHWGYAPSDGNFKSPRDIVDALARCASGAGNLLLNVGPDGSGRIPPKSEGLLREVGRWLTVHGEAIYGSERTALTWNMWGPSAARGNTMYLFLRRLYETTLVVGGLTPNIERARLLGSAAQLTWERRADRTFIRGLPAVPPHPMLPVLALDLDGPPDQDIARVIGVADVFPNFPN